MNNTIDSHVPPPPNRQTMSGKFAELDLLEVGQSVVYPRESMSSLAVSIAYRQNRYGKKFTRRSTAEGTRVWRLA
jgi:hypothetical protein